MVSTESCCLHDKETDASWLKISMVLRVCLGRRVITWLWMTPLATVFVTSSQVCGFALSPDVALP